MPGRLSIEQTEQLEEWIDTGPKRFKLLYSITSDGCDAAQFHKMCDNEGPTVTVLYNPQGSVYGGYTSISWQVAGRWKRDDKAFLFQLAFSNKKLFRKFPSNKTDTIVRHFPSDGPCFGAGYDLKVLYGSIQPVYGVFPFAKNGGKMQPSDSFVYNGVTAADINNGTMDVVEVEVYGFIGKCAEDLG